MTSASSVPPPTATGGSSSTIRRARRSSGATESRDLDRRSAADRQLSRPGGAEGGPRAALTEALRCRRPCAPISTSRSNWRARRRRSASRPREPRRAWRAPTSVPPRSTRNADGVPDRGDDQLPRKPTSRAAARPASAPRTRCSWRCSSDGESSRMGAVGARRRTQRRHERLADEHDDRAHGSTSVAPTPSTSGAKVDVGDRALTRLIAAERRRRAREGGRRSVAAYERAFASRSTWAERQSPIDHLRDLVVVARRRRSAAGLPAACLRRAACSGRTSTSRRPSTSPSADP